MRAPSRWATIQGATGPNHEGARNAADHLERLPRAPRRRAERPRAARPVRDQRLPGPLSRPHAAHVRSSTGTSRSAARSTSRAAGAGTSCASLPSEEVTVDIHCVTKWSKLDTVWRGVSVDTLLDGVETSAEFVVQFCDDGYTTNLPLDDVTGGKAWVAFAYDGEPLEPEHGGPARMLVPHLYFWKSAKWVRGLRLLAVGRARFLGSERLPQLRGSVAGTALLGRLNWQVAEVVDVVEETPRVKTIAFDVAGWPGHLPGPARRRPSHSRRRLPGPAQLLDRLGPGRYADRAHGRAARRTARFRPT